MENTISSHDELEEPLLLHYDKWPLVHYDKCSYYNYYNFDNQKNACQMNVKTPRFSRNLLLLLLVVGVRAAMEAAWFTSVLSVYIYLLSPEDEPSMIMENIGYISAIEAATQFLASTLSTIILSYGHNHHRRFCCDKPHMVLLRVASFVGIAASYVTYRIAFNNPEVCSHSNNAERLLGQCKIWGGRFLIVMVPMLWGAFDGITWTTIWDVMSKNVSAKTETNKTQQLQQDPYQDLKTLRKFSTCGSVIGSLIGSLIVLSSSSFRDAFNTMDNNTWILSQCSGIICKVQCLYIPCFFLLWCYSTNDDENNIEDFMEKSSPALTTMVEIYVHPDNIETQRHYNHETDTSEEDEIDEVILDSSDKHRKQRSFMTLATVTTTLCSDALCAMAGRLCFRYFSLFLFVRLRRPLVLVQMIEAVTCLMGATLLSLIEGWAIRMERCPFGTALEIAGITLLLLTHALWYFYRYHYNNNERGVNSEELEWRRAIMAGTMLVSYMLKSFLSSTSTMARSFSARNASRRSRARSARKLRERVEWSVLGLIYMFAWGIYLVCFKESVFARVLGEGIFSFLPVTPAFQIVAMLPLVPLLTK